MFPATYKVNCHRAIAIFSDTSQSRLATEGSSASARGLAMLQSAKYWPETVRECGICRDIALRRRALRNGLKDEDVRKTSNSVEDNAWDGHRALQIGVENHAGVQGFCCPRRAAEAPREFFGEKKIGHF